MDAEGRSTSQQEPVSPDAVTDLGDRLLKGRLYEALFPSLAEPMPRVGRFALLRELGRGGMGVVFAAYDEQLDRKVALKLLHSHASGDEAARERLLREAQALARLSHPNVVQVHEAGVHDEQVYLAMELVEGRTLRQWLEDETTMAGRGRWRAVLEVMVAAGEGLAAAHDAGLMHRDFKPDNVLVGDDGRVRVVDFGLATEGARSERASGAAATDDATEPEPTSTGAQETPRPLARLTRTGAAVGTVLYMPLEQLNGQGRVDARSDQFSYCVTLYEALFGERPFVADTRLAMVAALEDGEPRSPMATAEVPRWLRRVLWRGLSKEPGARYESMRVLLEGLTRPMRRRRLGVASAVVLVVLGTGLGFGMARGGVAEVEPCAAAGRAMDDTWNDEARQRLRDGLPTATAGFAVESIDQWSEGWRETAAAACEQVHVEQVASAESLDVRGPCLEEQRHRLDSVLRVMESRDPAGPEAVGALAALEQPRDCLLDRGDPVAGLSEEQMEGHRRLSDRLVELDLVQAGRSVAERSELVEDAYEEAEQLGLFEVQRRAAYLRGRLSLLAADRSGAQQWLGIAMDRAEQLGLDDGRARTWLLLLESALYLEMDVPRAEWNLARVEPLLEERPRPSLLHALAELAAGRVALARGELGLAGTRVDAGLEELDALGPTAQSHLYRGLRLRILVSTRQGDTDAALELERRARRTLLLQGDDALDNRLGIQRYDDGVARLVAGDLDGARRVLTEALTQIRAELPGSMKLAQAHVALSRVADASGEPSVARAHAEQADSIVRDVGGPEHPERTNALSALGVAAFRQERYEDAAASFELALRIVDRQPRPEPIERADHAVNFAEACLALGRHREAEGLLEEAISSLESELGPDHVDLALPYKVRGAVRRSLSRFELAEADLRRALSLYEQGTENLVELAQTRWELALVLDALGRDDEALEHARLVERRFKALGPDWMSRAARVHQWVQARDEPRPARTRSRSGHQRDATRGETP